MQYQREPSPSESLFWPIVWAVALHVLMFAMLFVSFAFAPELPPSRPIVQATLYQLKSQSQATTQTNQKIAGETKKTTAPIYETEQLEQKKLEQEQAAAAKAAEQKQAEAAQKAEAAAKAADTAEQKKAEAEQKRLADVAKKKAADDAAKQKAAEEAKKKAAEDAKKKAAEDAKKKAAAEAAKKKAADDAKKKAAADAARKAVEDKKAAALAELLSEDVGRQQALADEVGDQVAGSLDDLIVMLVSQQWRRPPSARNGMSVEVMIEMLPDGTITNASVTRSSGDAPFDNSAVQAVRNVGRVAEMQQLDRATFDRLYRQRRAVFKPEDLGL
ncbi:MAG: cell envelope integrity protein TolA [Gammaproteobacteria bacterium]|nr:cell envelope integrity protein TolA [Gammaproteobacteria bacterium]MBU1491402.1 cell envelope integrity protein TolA [Gammaproteobacteria bacterium]MBU2140390.1 cell envelope integrity protein TolA [Gammaproteobacteria bacterium]MBU2324998.1 cell envelope integrity protein TolA [Gammaproteobacteria bacterium]